MSWQEGFKQLADFGVVTDDIVHNYTKRRLNKEPIKSFDGLMYDTIYPYLMRTNPEVAKQVKRSIKDDRVTKNFCEVSKLYEQVERFIDPEVTRESMIHNVNYCAAWSILRDILPKPKGQLSPLEIDFKNDFSSIFSNPDASSGILAYPKSKAEAVDIIGEVAQYIIEHYHEDNFRFSLPAIALTRSQITDYIVDGKIDSKGIKYKTRLVMCVDAASVIVEQRFGQPILDRIMKPMKQYAGGSNDKENAQFLVNFCNNKRWTSLDYSKFDATIQNWLLYDIFNFFSEYFDVKYKKDFEWIARNFVNMQLMMPNGEIYDLHRGIKSGSYFTQMVGSLANMLMILTYLCSRFGHKDGNMKSINIQDVKNQLYSQEIKDDDHLTMMVMGDDNILFTYDKIHMEDLSHYLHRNFGVNVTVEGEKSFKQGEPGDNPEFLKRIWTTTGQMRDELEMWVNLIHPERKRDYEDYSPYHILYGYLLTFRRSVSKYVTEYELIQGMHDSPSGLDAFLRIKLNDLPGSLRSQILNRGIRRDDLVEELKLRYENYMKACNGAA